MGVLQCLKKLCQEDLEDLIDWLDKGNAIKPSHRKKEKRPYRIFTLQQKKEYLKKICCLRKKGLIFSEISKKLGISSSFAYRLFNDFREGRMVEYKKRTPDEVAELQRRILYLKENHLTCKQIGEILNCSYSYVSVLYKKGRVASGRLLKGSGGK